MTRMIFFALSLLALAVVLRKSGLGTSANGGKGGRGLIQAAKRPEYEDVRGSSETRDAYPVREVAVLEGLPSDAQPEERTLPPAVRIAGYAFLIAVAFEASVVLGGALAVGMEYLVGWPDTWWL